MSAMSDPYTIELRLCDADGMVSHRPIQDESKTLDKSYLDRLNRLRNETLIRQGNKPQTVTEPFICTGHAHLFGEHIRCTSPAHNVEMPSTVLYEVVPTATDLAEQRQRADTARRLVELEKEAEHLRWIIKHVCSHPNGFVATVGCPYCGALPPASTEAKP